MRTILNKRIVDTIVTDINDEDYYVMDFDNIDSSSLLQWVLKERGERHSRPNLDWSVINQRYCDLYINIARGNKR